MPGTWFLRVGLVWLIVLVAGFWYLGRRDRVLELVAMESLVAMEALVMGFVLATTASLGAALVAERRKWLLALPTALFGGVIATVVFLISAMNTEAERDTYYPALFVFMYFSVVLLVALAIGALFALFWRAIGRATKRVGLVWFIALVAGSWYLGRRHAENMTRAPEPSVMEPLVMGFVLAATASLGAALVAERRKWWLLALPTALFGGLIATVVDSMSIATSEAEPDSYYPGFVFMYFSVVLLVALAIGALLAVFWRAIRRARTKSDASTP